MIDLRYEKPLRVPEAIAFLGICERTLNNWFDAGLEKLKIGGKVYTSVEAVQRFSVDATTVTQPSTRTERREDEQMLAEMRRHIGTRRPTKERSQVNGGNHCPSFPGQPAVSVAAMA